MDRIQLDLFGGPRASVSGTELTLSPLQAAVLGILASYDGRGISRVRLVELMWQEDADASTRHRLSQLLYSLSCKLPLNEYYRTEGDYVALRGDRFNTDFTLFKSRLRSSDLIGAWEILARGFLAEADISTDSFGDWIDARRLRLRSGLRERSVLAWSEAEQRGRWGDAAKAARTLLALDPSDHHLRQLLWALAMAGRADEADGEYHRYTEAVRREGQEPEPESAELLERIRSMAPTPRTSRVVPHVEPPIVGRSTELRALKKAVTRLPEELLRILHVSGEGGAGKTRLVQEALGAARLSGTQVFVGGSGEFERDIPLNSILEALAKPHVGEALQRLEEPWRTVLLALMPQFHVGPDPIPEPPYVQPGSMPRRLFEAFRMLFLELAKSGPIVMLLDDFHWTDETSIAVLEYLRRRWHEGDFVVIITTRPEILTPGHRVKNFLGELAQEGRVSDVGLGELDGPAGRQLVKAVSERPLGRREEEDICALGGNNPFFIIELTLEYLAGRLVPRVDPRESLPIPYSIQQVLERRLAELSPDADRTLINMATYARPVGPVALEELTGLSAEASVGALEELAEQRLVTWSDGMLSVRHELIRQSVYAAMSDPRRSWLHRKVGTFILEQGDPLPVDDLAFHFDRGGMREEALKYALLAAERAEGSGAVPEALRYLRIARRNNEDPELQADIIWRLGHLSYLHGSFSDAVEILEEAADRLREWDRYETALIAEIESIDSQRQLFCAVEAEDFIRELNDLQESALHIKAFEALAAAIEVKLQVYDSVGNIAAARAQLEEAASFITNTEGRACCGLHFSLTAHLFFGSIDHAFAHAVAAVDLARDNRFTDLQLPSLNRLFLVLSYQGKGMGPMALQALEEARALASTSGDIRNKFHLWANAGVWHLDTGAYDRAEHCFGKALEIIEDIPLANEHCIANVNLGELHLKTGDLETALGFYERAWERSSSASLGRTRTLSGAGLGLCALFRGDLTLAKKHESLLPERPAEWYFDPAPIVVFQANMLLRRGNAREAVGLLEDTATEIRNRYVPAWINLSIEAARIRQRAGLKGAACSPLTTDALAVASQLGLARKSRELQRFVKG